MAMTNRESKAGGESSSFDLYALLHPAAAFADPMAVVNDPDLTFNEKRTLLSSWAFDASSTDEGVMQEAPGRQAIVFNDVMDALRALDRLAFVGRVLPRYRRVLANRSRGTLRRKRPGSAGDQGRSIA
jgi:hypothetical protein